MPHRALALRLRPPSDVLSDRDRICSAERSLLGHINTTRRAELSHSLISSFSHRLSFKVVVISLIVGLQSFASAALFLFSFMPRVRACATVSCRHNNKLPRNNPTRCLLSDLPKTRSIINVCYLLPKMKHGVPSQSGCFGRFANLPPRTLPIR
ncbi:hypothetical protein BKA63DRAFT_205615 [Paraphoma chrysanthemicola]|nr:hypothetical protein BKA63DRAFT_205615 [Paraphoma chrysanthemicola]